MSHMRELRPNQMVVGSQHTYVYMCVQAKTRFRAYLVKIKLLTWCTIYAKGITWCKEIPISISTARY